jgi:hypothetical protein
VALRRDPKQVQCYIDVGRIHLGEGRNAEAIEMAQAALAIDARLPAAQALLADAGHP